MKFSEQKNETWATKLYPFGVNVTPNAVKLAMELGSTLMNPSEEDLKVATSVGDVSITQTLINLREYQMNMDRQYYRQNKFCPGCLSPITRSYRPNNRLINGSVEDNTNVHLFRHQLYHKQVCNTPPLNSRIFDVCRYVIYLCLFSCIYTYIYLSMFIGDT